MNDFVRMSLQAARQGTILDTNLLLLFLIGCWNAQKIADFERTSDYSMEDFRLLRKLLDQSKQLVTTPHILTEVCNLTESLNKNNDYKLFKILAGIQSYAKERRQEAAYLMGENFHKPFLRLGIADTSLLDASVKGHLILTDDAACATSIYQAGGLVLNINHLRSKDWLT